MQEGSRRVSVRMIWWEKHSTHCCWLWRWRKRATSQGISKVHRYKKGQADSFLEERNSPSTLVSAFHLHSCQIWKSLCCLKTLMFVTIYYSSNRKQIQETSGFPALSMMFAAEFLWICCLFALGFLLVFFLHMVSTLMFLLISVSILFPIAYPSNFSLM